jgi:hypothetical protein
MWEMPANGINGKALIKGALSLGQVGGTFTAR